MREPVFVSLKVELLASTVSQAEVVDCMHNKNDNNNNKQFI